MAAGQVWIGSTVLLATTTLTPGFWQVAFHHSLTFHGSGPNRATDPRMAIAVHMQSDECRYEPGFWHSNVRDLGPHATAGQAFNGPCFPVLYARLSNK